MGRNSYDIFSQRRHIISNHKMHSLAREPPFILPKRRVAATLGLWAVLVSLLRTINITMYAFYIQTKTVEIFQVYINYKTYYTHKLGFFFLYIGIYGYIRNNTISIGQIESINRDDFRTGPRSRSYNLIYVYNILVVPKSKSHRRRTTVYPRATYTYIVSSPVSTSHCVMYRSSPAAARSTTHVVTRV